MLTGLRAQPLRRFAQVGFFVLFVLAPPLNLFRLDVDAGHFVLFGQAWVLDVEALIRSGRADPWEVAWRLLSRGLLPIVLVVGGTLWVAYRWGRLYCGWLCPHFSVVELLNALTRRAIGRFSLWDRDPLPDRIRPGVAWQPNKTYWLVIAPTILALAWLWAISLLTYLQSPALVWGNLWAGTLTRNQMVFIGVGTGLFSAEFLLARHLFCRYACAAGLFQSLVWLVNKKALVIGYQRPRAAACGGCDNACDHACPMHLTPRTVKRLMFACVQCGRCLAACENRQAEDSGQAPLLHWTRADLAAASEAAFTPKQARQAQIEPSVPAAPPSEGGR